MKSHHKHTLKYKTLSCVKKHCEPPRGAARSEKATLHSPEKQHASTAYWRRAAMPMQAMPRGSADGRHAHGIIIASLLCLQSCTNQVHLQHVRASTPACLPSEIGPAIT